MTEKYCVFLYTIGKTASLEVHENYFVSSGLPPDTEYTFQVSLESIV